MKQVITRYLDGKIHVYDVSSAVEGPLSPVATYAVESDEKELKSAVAPNLSKIAYATRDSILCISQNGDLLWRYEMEPPSTEKWVRSPEFIFSLDGAWLWVYRPDAMNDRGPDILVVLRASTGKPVAQTQLDTVGEGSQMFLHPDGRYVLLDVDEGQDGVKLYYAALSGGHQSIDLHSYGWEDHCLIDISPDGRLFMTTDRCDVSFHAFPGGEGVLTLPWSAFHKDEEDDGEDEDEEEEVSIDWNGGFLTPEIAIVTLVGEKDDQEWHRHCRLDLRTGRQGHFETHSRDNYDFEPLGDGSWIASNPDGSPIRRKISSS